MILTIDGPAGTGKSTVSRRVAERLGFAFLDTGAMYRAIALAAVRRQANLDEPRDLLFAARHARIEFDWTQHPPGLLLNGEPVSHLLRSGEVTRASSKVAVLPAIREQLVEQQRRIGAGIGNLVTEGRDQGSVVFPQAELKFYLDASAAERARRRVQQLRGRGEMPDYNDILKEIIDRDSRDANREVGPMVIPEGAEVIDTTSLTEDQVIERIVARAQQAGASR